MNAQSKSLDEMRMSAKEFDRIMGQALRVKPEEAKPKRPRKTASGRKKRGTRK